MTKKILCLALALLLAIPVVGYAAIVKKIKMNKSSITLYLNEDNMTKTPYERDLNVINKPVGYNTKYKFKWYSEDSSIAKVSKSGLVTGLKVGATEVKCDMTYKSNGKLYGTAVCVVNVKANAEKVVIINAPDDRTMYLGQTFDFNRRMTSANGGKATDKTEWFVSDTSIASVDKNGVVKANGLGTFDVYVKTYQSSSTKELGYTAESEPVTVKIIMSEEDIEKLLSETTERQLSIDVPTGEGLSSLSIGETITVKDPNYKYLLFKPDDAQASGESNLKITVRSFNHSAALYADPEKISSLSGGRKGVTIIDIENTGDEAESLKLNINGKFRTLNIGAHSKLRLIDVGAEATISDIYKAFMALDNDEQRKTLLSMLSDEMLKQFKLTFETLISDELLSSVIKGSEYSDRYSLITMLIDGTANLEDSEGNVTDLKDNSGEVLTGGLKSQGGEDEEEGERFTGRLVIEGEFKFGSTLTANVYDANDYDFLTYQWKRGGQILYTGDNPYYELGADDIGSSITCVVTSGQFSGSLTKSTPAIEKADGLSAPSGLYTDYMKIGGTTTEMEYDRDASFSSPSSCGSGTTTVSVQGNYYVRYKETATRKAGIAAGPLTIGVPVTELPPTALPTGFVTPTATFTGVPPTGTSFSTGY